MTQTIQQRKNHGLVSSRSNSGPNLTNVRINNVSGNPRKINLGLVGNQGYFSIPKKYHSIELKPKANVTIPVKLVEGNPFRIMDANVEHKAYVRWKEEDGNGLLLSAPVKAFAPLYAPSKPIRCMHYSPVNASIYARKLHHSPPDITRTVFRAGTSNVANIGEVDHHYFVNIEQENDVLQIENHWPIVGVGETLTGGYSWAMDHRERTETFEPNETYLHVLMARNEDGSVTDRETFYTRREIGYQHSCIPNDPTVSDSEVGIIKGFLDSISSWLMSDGLVDCGRYSEYWNVNILREPDAVSCNTLSFDELGCLFNGGEAFSDLDYLTAPVGSGGLTDDMLAALESIVIYTKPTHLPRTFRIDEHFNPSHDRLCGEEGVLGFAYGFPDRAPGEFADWIAICREENAGDGTIMHELFHYAARDNFESEDRAFLVSYLYAASVYGWKPLETWPNW